MISNDTIAAIATSVGEAGIGIIRISGPESLKVARNIFCNLSGVPVIDFSPRKMLYGKVLDPLDRDLIDEALAVYMPAPHSYTCEDVVEFQIHGGKQVLQRLLGVILKNGARLAHPGEFTLRAFLNGRLDLAQAEAVMEIIRAKTDASAKIASSHLSGDLSRKISIIRHSLIDFLVRIEASLDYPEDDIPLIDQEVAQVGLLEVQKAILELLATTKTGRILSDGLQTVIVGRPNVGKSSLLNAFLRTERALVTEVPGTTRDSIEEYLNLRGIPLRIVDTAGIRETEDRVEKLGILRTKESIASASLILFMIDASEPWSMEDSLLLETLPNVPVIVVINKTDLPVRLDLDSLKKNFRFDSIVSISAKEGTGLSQLEDAVETLVYGGQAHLSSSMIVSNIRHETNLQAASDNLCSAINSIHSAIPLDCVSIDIRMAIDSLGQITGETVSDEVVREIFAKFCLGK